MKAAKSSGINRPFSNLKSLLEKKSVPLRSFPAERIFAAKQKLPADDNALFEIAMSDVTPLDKDNVPEFEFEPIPVERSEDADACEEIAKKLRDLVERGEGFVVENTPEYIEGSCPDVYREVVRKLHRGEFSTEAFIDLHGLNVHQARDSFDRFLKDCVATGKRGVLIVHGRGLSSPDEPVLKGKVVRWLTRGRWRKWVLAFSSARSCDGGAGATCVLLRRSPASGRRLKGCFVRTS